MSTGEKKFHFCKILKNLNLSLVSMYLYMYIIKPLNAVQYSPFQWWMLSYHSVFYQPVHNVIIPCYAVQHRPFLWWMLSYHSVYSSILYSNCEISHLFHGVCDLSHCAPCPCSINGQLKQVTLVTGTSLSDGFQCLLCLWKKKQDPFDVKILL